MKQFNIHFWNNCLYRDEYKAIEAISIYSAIEKAERECMINSCIELVDIEGYEELFKG